MISEKMKSSKGVTLIALAITIIIITVLTNIIIYNLKDNLLVDNLQNMQTDIGNLRNKVSNYYAEHGEIPVTLKYTNIDEIKNAGLISETTDKGDFFVINLSALDNLTLNYGKDFEQSLTDANVNNYTDLYIINETSHNIFYVEGIQVDSEMFYTDYTSESIDKASVDLRYVENVKIPEGFYYVGGTKDTGIVISDVKDDDMSNTKQGNQFVWVPVDNFDDFYREDFGSGHLSENIFVNDTPAEGKYYEPSANGIMDQTEVERMYKSVKDNKGFYIARYEAGTEDGTSTGKALSKKNETVCTGIKWGNSLEDKTGGAVEVAEKMADNNHYTDVTSTLCYSVQWDAVMRWISEDTSLSEYLQNSESIGNYGTSLIQTGSNEQYKLKNIYDMAGNANGWTIEEYGTSSVVKRGGTTSEKAISSRSGSSGATTTDNNTGFRVTLFLNEEEKWSPVYDKAGVYQDKNEDTAYVPEGFQVSETLGENTVQDGLVIKNATTGNSYVWIKVPKSIYKTATSNTDYKNIEKDMQEYAKDYGDANYSDEWYDGCGIADKNKYDEQKHKMLSSVYDKGGFWVGQYEAGVEKAKISGQSSEGVDSLVSTNGLPESQEDKYPYNWVTCSQAQQLASKVGEKENADTSLMFGIQWDLVLKYIEESNAKTKEQLKEDSGSWGNYTDSEFTVIKGKYSENDGQLFNDVPNKGYLKTASKKILLTTGATKRNSVLNIYDIAGNVAEWTLEQGISTDKLCQCRGGSCNGSGGPNPASDYGYYDTICNNERFGFRLALYVE